jgi:hypothetical protein
LAAPHPWLNLDYAFREGKVIHGKKPPREEVIATFKEFKGRSSRRRISLKLTNGLTERGCLIEVEGQSPYSPFDIFLL